MNHTVYIEDVVKSYGNFNAVDHISLTIKPGEFFTLLGPSGCGKTTLLRMIAGFNPIDNGKIRFDDQVINGIPAEKRNIGMVFQNYAIFPHMTVRKNVEYGLIARKVKNPELTDRVDSIMKLMQIYEFRDRMPQQLSGGQQQRVALARALVINPGVLLMDEPLSNLDAKLRVEMRTNIKKIQKQMGITTIYVTHDQEEALAISDRIAVMKAGHVMQCGTPIEIYKNPANAFVAGFIGTSSFVDAFCKDGFLKFKNGKTLFNDKWKNLNGDVKVAIRPEYANIVSKSEGLLTAKISLETFLGDFVNYEILLENQEILQLNEYTKYCKDLHHADEEVGISFDSENIYVYKENDK